MGLAELHSSLASSRPQVICFFLILQPYELVQGALSLEARFSLGRTFEEIPAVGSNAHA